MKRPQRPPSSSVGAGPNAPTKEGAPGPTPQEPRGKRRWYILVAGASFLLVVFFFGKPTPTPTPTSLQQQLQQNDEPDYCQHYDGVLWISQGDRNGAAGTIFYLFIMNQLLYAERYNLQPFIHLNGVSKHVYDDQVHAGVVGNNNYEMGPKMEVAWEQYKDPLAPDKLFRYPGKPRINPNSAITNSNQKTLLQVDGTGIWNSYFQSTIPLTLGSQNQTFQVDITHPCPNKPFVQLESDEELVRGIHLNCPYCVRSWKYGGVPPSLKQLPGDSYQEWWQPMRETASKMVSKYYLPKPHLLQLAQRANPFNNNDNQKCLAMHIRHSDKANKREKIPLAAFLPYCEAFAEVGGTCIYLATDSSRVIDKIQTEWPQNVVQTITWQSNIIRSPNETAVFDANVAGGQDQNGHHHRTNTEVLVDILAMARCEWILHGLSAVSEATIYTNLNLHASSVNLEFYRYYKRHPNEAASASSGDIGGDIPVSVAAFRQMVLQ